MKREDLEAHEAAQPQATLMYAKVVDGSLYVHPLEESGWPPMNSPQWTPAEPALPKFGAAEARAKQLDRENQLLRLTIHVLTKPQPKGTTT